MISLTLDLAPYASQTGGKRVARTANGVRFFKDEKCSQWERDAALMLRQFRPRKPLEGPVFCDVLFVFDRPQDLMAKSFPDGLIYHTRRPDRDNCMKILFDCMTKAGFWLDDAQVCDGPVRKAYAARGGRAQIRISTYPITE